MKQLLEQPATYCEEYDQKHPCMTVEEVRYLLHSCRRYSPYWMYFLLRITTGMRPDEALQLTLYNLSPDCSELSYGVDKPRRFRQERGILLVRKHRRIVLDSWVASELREYLAILCRNVDGVFVSPYERQRLFPWKHIGLIDTYWYKLRRKMRAAGFDSMRLEREYHRPQKEAHDKTYVLRPHILRHFAASVMLCKLGNLTSVRDWIKHERSQTTDGYIHSPESIGATEDFLRCASWAEILGYDEEQRSLAEGQATSQTSIDMYGF